MKSIALFLLLLLISLALYLGYSERFAYLNGTICQKIGWESKAAELYEKGCRNNNLPACVDLGILYETGRGVDKDIDKARKLYEKASRHGYKPAEIRLNTKTMNRQ